MNAPVKEYTFYSSVKVKESCCSLLDRFKVRKKEKKKMLKTFFTIHLETLYNQDFSGSFILSAGCDNPEVSKLDVHLYLSSLTLSPFLSSFLSRVLSLVP